MAETKDKFILTRKRRSYKQIGENPKISIDRQTYIKLQEAAAETGLSISAIAKQAVDFAFARLKYVEE